MNMEIPVSEKNLKVIPINIGKIFIVCEKTGLFTLSSIYKDCFKPVRAISNG